MPLATGLVTLPSVRGRRPRRDAGEPWTRRERIDERWVQYQHACPYLRQDERGCYCTSPELPAGGDPYMPCDTASLQPWCLTEAEYTKYMLYPAGDVP